MQVPSASSLCALLQLLPSTPETSAETLTAEGATARQAETAHLVQSCSAVTSGLPLMIDKVHRPFIPC